MDYNLVSKNILISIQPQYVDQISTGIKTIELRKRFPENVGANNKLVIYCSRPVQSIVGYCEINHVKKIKKNVIWSSYKQYLGINKKDFDEYYANHEYGYAIFLGKYLELSNPISLEKLTQDFGISPPQSYRYLDIEHTLIGYNA